MGATLNRCEPFIVGVCKIVDQKDSIAKKAVGGKEQREIYEEARSDFRKKAIHSIPLRNVIKKENLNLGPLSFSIPRPLQIKKNLKNLIREKIIYRQEKIFCSTRVYFTKCIDCGPQFYDDDATKTFCFVWSRCLMPSN